MSSRYVSLFLPVSLLFLQLCLPAPLGVSMCISWSPLVSLFLQLWSQVCHVSTVSLSVPPCITLCLPYLPMSTAVSLYLPASFWVFFESPCCSLCPPVVPVPPFTSLFLPLASCVSFCPPQSPFVPPVSPFVLLCLRAWVSRFDGIPCLTDNLFAFSFVLIAFTEIWSCPCVLSGLVLNYL